MPKADVAGFIELPTKARRIEGIVQRLLPHMPTHPRQHFGGCPPVVARAMRPGEPCIRIAMNKTIKYAVILRAGDGAGKDRAAVIFEDSHGVDVATTELVVQIADVHIPILVAVGREERFVDNVYRRNGKFVG